MANCCYFGWNLRATFFPQLLQYYHLLLTFVRKHWQKVLKFKTDYSDLLSFWQEAQHLAHWITFVWWGSSRNCCRLENYCWHFDRKWLDLSWVCSWGLISNSKFVFLCVSVEKQVFILHPLLSYPILNLHYFAISSFERLRWLYWQQPIVSLLKTRIAVRRL